MQLSEAIRYLMDAGTLDANVVCITGGEPMLYPSLVRKLVSLSRRSSIPEIWLFTNSFWAHNRQKAHSTVKEFKSLGLTKISTSIDFFHQRYIPIEHVKNAIEAAVECGLDVCVDARFVGDTNEKNRFNSATHRYLESMRNLLLNVEVIKAQPLFVGRAAESLTKYVKLRPLSEVLDEKCPGAWAGGTLASPAGVDVDQNGSVTLCPGLSIGNTRESSFRELIEKYDYRNFALISALYDGGIEGLKHLASENGFVPEPAYADGCHFCYEARKFLRKSFPEACIMLID